MKNKVLMSLLATATIGAGIATSAMINHQNTTHIMNKVLMVNNNLSSSVTNEAIVINGNSNMNLYGFPNGSGIVSYLSTGEMLTILGAQQNGFCKVEVQETGAIGYINISNIQNIINGTNDNFTNASGSGCVVNVSTRLRLRNKPSMSANINGYLTNGTQFSILGKQGQWYKISINGQVGFIYKEYASINSFNISANQAPMTSGTQKGNMASSTSSSSSNSSSGITSKTKNSGANNNDTINSSSSNVSSAKNSNISQGNNSVMSLANIQTTVVDQMVQYFRNYDASQHIPAKDLGSPKLFYQTAQYIINQYVTQNSLKDIFGMNGPTYNNIKVNSYYSTKKVSNAINIEQNNWSTTGNGYYVVSIQKI